MYGTVNLVSIGYGSVYKNQLQSTIQSTVNNRQYTVYTTYINAFVQNNSTNESIAIAMICAMCIDGSKLLDKLFATI